MISFINKFKKKIGGNWHTIDVWEKERCIVGYKSGGVIFLDLKSKKELKYIPFYVFNNFIIQDDGLIIVNNANQYYLLETLNSKLKQLNNFKEQHVVEKETYLAELNLKSSEEIRAADISPDYIVCAYKTKGIDIYDKNKKKLLYNFDFPGYSFVDDLKIFRNKIYIGDVFGLRTITIRKDNNLHLDDSTIFRGWPKDVDIQDQHVFIADVLGVKILDKNKNFEIVGRFETNKNRIAKVIVKNDLVFLACEARGLRILDITNINQPSLIGGILLKKGAWDIDEFNGFLYLASYTEGLIKVDYGNIKCLKTVSKYHSDNQIIGVKVYESLVIVAASYFGTKILNQNLEKISEIKIKEGRCWSNLLYRDVLFCACGKSGVYVYDLKDVTHPRFLYQIKTKQARDLVIKENRLYVADGKNGVEIYDIREITNPIHLENIPSSAFTRGVNVDKNYIYKADGDGGLEIYER